MPLFASKFSFKKAPTRRANSVNGHKSTSVSSDSEHTDTDSERHNERKVKKAKRTLPKSASLFIGDPKSQSKPVKSKLQESDLAKSKKWTLLVNKQEYRFEPKDGRWKESAKAKPIQPGLIAASPETDQPVTTNQPEVNQLKDQNRKLEEENRLLKLKIEILMEMVGEAVSVHF